MAVYNRLELKNAVARGDWAKLTTARKAGVPWGAMTGADGMSVLHAALLSAPDVVVEIFIAREAPLDWYYTDSGRIMFPWLDAAQRRRDGCCALMIDSGMTLDVLPPGQQEPLLVHAFEQIMPKTLRALIGRGEWLGGLDAGTQARCLEVLADATEPTWRPDIPAAERVAFIETLAGSGWTPMPEAIRAFDRRRSRAAAEGDIASAVTRLVGGWQAASIGRGGQRKEAARKRG